MAKAKQIPPFDANVFSLYRRGMTVRDIQARLEALYQVQVAPGVLCAS